MLNEEFSKVKEDTGGLIAFNSFLSTSTERSVSLFFAEASKNNPATTPVLFTMGLDSTIQSSPFASIDKFSFFEGTEHEFLFSMHTVFRIMNVSEDHDNGIWNVTLKIVCDENDQYLHRLTEHMRNEVQHLEDEHEPRVGHRLAKVMMRLGQWKRAKEYYEMLISVTDETDSEHLAFLHHQLGYAYDELGDSDSALSQYQQTINYRLSYLPPDDPKLANTYGNIGCTLKDQGKYDEAIEYYQKTLNIDLRSIEPDYKSIAYTYSNMGNALRRQGKLEEALQNQELALQIRLKYLPPTHPDIAQSYSNIGGIYFDQRNYTTSLELYEKCHNIERKSLPMNHPDLSSTYHNLATVFDALGRHDEAVKHAEHAVAILRFNFPPEHRSIQICQRYLDRLREKQ